MKRATAIAGVFFQSDNPAKLKEWYEANLGITGIFHRKDLETSSSYTTVWCPVLKSSQIFNGTEKSYLISYQVSHLDQLSRELKKEGVFAIGDINKDENGSFIGISDPDGNKIILREPSGKDIDGSKNDPDRVTGLGGVFFKSKDPKVLNEWYIKHLGLAITEWGCSFEWIDPNNAGAKAPATTAWSIFKADTTYFSPSEKQFMFNYRVKNLAEL